MKNFTLKPYFYIFVARFLYSDLCNYKSSIHLQEDFFKHQHVSQEINANSIRFALVTYLEANFVASAV